MKAIRWCAHHTMQRDMSEKEHKSIQLVEKEVIYEDLGLRDYKETWDYQEKLFGGLLDVKLHNRSADPGRERKQVNRLIFVEHPHVYTLGRSGSENNLLVNNIQLQARDATFYRIDRGGDITYTVPAR